MNKLLDLFIKWAMGDKRWPLVLIVLILPLFKMVREFFELSYRQVFGHWCFLTIAGTVGILSGSLYFALVRHNSRRLKQGGSIALAGLVVLILGLVQMRLPPLDDDALVVAIAEFTPVGPDAENEAQSIAHRIERRLLDRQSAGAALKIVRLFDRISDPGGEATALAMATSREVRAHVVLWGEIRKDENELYVHPRLTIASQLRQAPMEAPKLLALASRGPTHLALKRRLATEIADIVVLTYGLSYYRAGDFDRSISILAHGDTAEAHFMRGVAYQAKGNFRKSLRPLKKAVSRTPQDAHVFNNLAVAYLHLGQLDDAGFYLQKSLDIVPNDPNILSNCALIHLGQGDYTAAANQFRLALAQGDHPMIRSNLAFCLFELGRTQAAVDEWEKTLASLKAWNKIASIPWDGLDARAGLAVGYHANGNPEAARTIYRQVIKLNPDYGNPGMLETKFFWPEKMASKAAELIGPMPGNTK